MTDPLEVLDRYNGIGAPEQIAYLGGAGGFSGAALWRVVHGGRPYCLRRWPQEHPTRSRLNYIHALVHRVHQAGLPVPAPLPTRGGATFVRWRGHYWELAPWMPGAAVEQPSPRQLEAAMTTLARFHLAARAASDERAASPGLFRRREDLQELLARSTELRAAIERSQWAEFRAAGLELLQMLPTLAPAIDAELGSGGHPIPLQSCLRDVWSAHVLFAEEEVSGLVDFGAAAVESVAGDIARLLGSLVGDEPHLRDRGLSAYEAVRPLEAAERMLIPVFERSGLLLGAAIWFRWILLENRQFEQRDLILRRIRDALGRLRSAPIWGP